ncbi:MAG: TlpA family protein disulfide reductase [Desulfobacteraceae bacterium]|nr:MAG: TlpA family protein disulfide reductase [Desulfobacteraceae bacterium]
MPLPGTLTARGRRFDELSVPHIVHQSFHHFAMHLASGYNGRSEIKMKIINKSTVIGFLVGAIISPCLLIGAFYLFAVTQMAELESEGFSPPDIPINNTVSLDWEIQSLDGRKVNLETEFEDKVLFVNFWATWCPPCVAEMPSIEKLHKKFKNRIVIICISQEDLKTLQEFQLKKKYKFPLYYMAGDPPEEFKTESIPVTFIISRNRKISLKHNGGANWSHPKVINFIKTLMHEKSEHAAGRDA